MTNTVDDSSDAAIAALEARLGALVRRFRLIAEGMRDLPLYNPAITVEAIDFQLHQGRGIGVLITPWFMNLILLPLTMQPFSMKAVGPRVMRALPAGPRQFMVSGDEVLGLYESLSILSPLLEIPDQETAVRRAREALAALMTPPETRQQPASGDAPDSDEMNATARARRDFIFGKSAQPSGKTEPT